MSYLLHQILAESAALYPDKEAVLCQEEIISYGELERESARLAGLLAGAGVARGDRVAIYMNRCISSIVAAFGILKAGAAYLPIDPLSPANRLSYILDTCRVSTLIVSRDKLACLQALFPKGAPLETVVVMDAGGEEELALGSARVLAWQALRDSLPEAKPCAATVDTDLAYILFTSGSTGKPKGVMLSHLNALTFVNAAYSFFGISSEDRFSNVCPLHFDMSVFDLYVAFRAGASVVIIPDSTALFPVKLAQAIARYRLTVWNSVPSALCLLAAYRNLASHDLSSLRLILFAGEPFPLKYLRPLQQMLPGARFCNMYGQTEANSSTYYWADRLPAEDGATLPIGRALPNFEVFALDEEGRPVSRAGEEGELYVRASTVALGYWGEPERSAGVFLTNPLTPDRQERVYRTGDLVRLDDDGYYHFLGRKDHMIKSRGYRIELGELESALLSHPEIENAAVVPIPDELIGNRLAVIVVPVSPGTIGKEEVRAHCARHLPKYMVPDIIEFSDSLPRTSSGKIDRQKLAAGRFADYPAA